MTVTTSSSKESKQWSFLNDNSTAMHELPLFDSLETLRNGKVLTERKTDTFSSDDAVDNEEGDGKYFKRREACIAYMESTVVDISIPPLFFKPVLLSSSRISSI